MAPTLYLQRTSGTGTLSTGQMIYLIGAGVPLAATFYYGIYFLFKLLLWRIGDARGQSTEIMDRSKKLRASLGKDFFSNLVNINFDHLDGYYLQTQEQGDKSFLLCLAAAVSGLVVLIAGVIAMFLGEVESGQVTTAAGIISEFIAAVFFYLYNQTILAMGSYHRKLVITQNIALALKITEGLSDKDRSGAQLALVEALTKDVNQLLAETVLKKP
jgi:hypothetical protein